MVAGDDVRRDRLSSAWAGQTLRNTAEDMSAEQHIGQVRAGAQRTDGEDRGPVLGGRPAPA